MNNLSFFRRTGPIPIDILLAVFFGGFLFVLLLFTTGGILVSLITAAVVIGLFALMHYLLWGQALARNVVREGRHEGVRIQVHEVKPADEFCLTLSEAERAELIGVLQQRWLPLQLKKTQRSLSCWNDCAASARNRGTRDLSSPCAIRYNLDMSTISIHDIERDLPGFLDRVEAGETFLVLRDNHPVAEVKPVPNHLAKRRPYGLAAGEFTVPADFDEPLPESILEDFEGR